MEEVIVHPKVFISYSWDTENGDDEHKKWVRDLATKLRSHGVDVILDQFDLRLGDDLPFFMKKLMPVKKGLDTKREFLQMNYLMILIKNLLFL